jgi:putative transposase
MGSGRASVRYLTTCPDDTVLRERFTALAQKRRRVGHRRLHVLLRREGHVVNRKRIQRRLSVGPRAGATNGGRWTSYPTRSPMGDASAS